MLWETYTYGKPNACQRLANGNTFVSLRDGAIEFGPDGALVHSYELGVVLDSISAVHKGREAHIYYTTSGGIGEYDTTGKTADRFRIPIRSITLSPPRNGVAYPGVEYLPGDRYLATDVQLGRVLEVDGAGKVLWQTDVPGACGAERLPDGHTLAYLNHKVVELDAAGKRVWTKETTGNVRRAYRR